MKYSILPEIDISEIVRVLDGLSIIKSRYIQICFFNGLNTHYLLVFFIKFVHPSKRWLSYTRHLTLLHPWNNPRLIPSPLILPVNIYKRSSAMLDLISSFTYLTQVSSDASTTTEWTKFTWWRPPSVARSGGRDAALPLADASSHPPIAAQDAHG